MTSTDGRKQKMKKIPANFPFSSRSLRSGRYHTGPLPQYPFPFRLTHSLHCHALNDAAFVDDVLSRAVYMRQTRTHNNRRTPQNSPLTTAHAKRIHFITRHRRGGCRRHHSPELIASIKIFISSLRCVDTAENMIPLHPAEHGAWRLFYTHMRICIRHILEHIYCILYILRIRCLRICVSVCASVCVFVCVYVFVCCFYML